MTPLVIEHPTRVPESGSRGRPGPTILVAIANAERRHEVAAALRGLARGCATMANGYHLIQHLANPILGDARWPRPRLVVADAILRGCTGVSLLTGLRDLGWDTSVVLLTERGDDHSRRQAWAAGVTGVFVEPCDLDDLRRFCSLVLDPEVGRALRIASLP